MDSNYAVISAFGSVPNDYYWYDTSWTLIKSTTGSNNGDSLGYFPSGTYHVIYSDQGTCAVDTMDFYVWEPLSLQIDSVNHTTCIGCNNGRIFYSYSGGDPFFRVYLDSVEIGDSSPIVSLTPGTHLLCITDDGGCMSCDTAIILDDPTNISPLNFEGRFNIYPNPAFKYVVYEQKENSKTMIRFLDLKGRPIKILTEVDLRTGLNYINCEDMSEGIYYVEGLVDNKYYYRKLIIIREN